MSDEGMDRDFADAIHAEAHGKPNSLKEIRNSRALNAAETEMLGHLQDGSMRRKRGSGKQILSEVKNFRRYAVQRYRDEMKNKKMSGAGREKVIEKISKQLNILFDRMHGKSALDNWRKNPNQNGADIPKGYRIERIECAEGPAKHVYVTVPEKAVDHKAAKAAFEKQGVLNADIVDGWFKNSTNKD